MSETFVALYDHFEDARLAVEDLTTAGIPRERISLVAHDTDQMYGKEFADVPPGEGASFGAVVGGLLGLGAALIPGVGPVLAAGTLGSALIGAGVGAAAGAATGGIVSSLVNFGIPEDDASIYAEALRRGGSLVSVKVDEAMAQRVEALLHRHNPVDIEQRMTFYRASGWTGYNASAQPYTTDQIQREREQHRSTMQSNPPARYAVVEGMAASEIDPDTGLLRQRSLGAATADPSMADTAPSGTTFHPRPFEDFDHDFRTHYHTHFSGSGYTYDQYSPAYRYGYDLGVNPRYRAYDWEQLSPELRRNWESRNPNTWEKFKNAVQAGWDRALGS